MPRYATWDAALAAAEKKYKAKATKEKYSAGLAPYAPEGKKVRTARISNYETGVAGVKEKFKERWGDIWLHAMYE